MLILIVSVMKTGKEYFMKALLTLVLLVGSLNVFASEVGEKNTDCVAGFQSGRFQEKPATAEDTGAATSKDVNSGVSR